MTKMIKYIFILLVSCLPVSSVLAMDIPDYIKDIDKMGAVRQNVDNIINALSSEAEGSQTAVTDAEYFNIIKRKLAADLYAEALTTRTNLLKNSSDAVAEKAKGAVSGALSGGLKDEREVIASETMPQYESIINRLNSIVALEAAAANLEGTIMITSMPKGDNRLEYQRINEEDTK